MHVAQLEISGVRGFHGARKVDLDFTRPDGSLAGWTVIAGRNGSGKSTLLQALAVVLAGPRATAVIPRLNEWMSADTETTEISVTARVSDADSYEETLLDLLDPHPKPWIRFNRPAGPVEQDPEFAEPEVTGRGIASFAVTSKSGSAAGRFHGWFYACYGPFRHLGDSGNWRPRRKSTAIPSQIASLFDESVTLADAVDWLIEQHLYQLEQRPGADNLIKVVMTLLEDRLLPDDFQICKVDSDGLWVSREGSEFPLREMSDGYRAITALMVDIIHRMHVAYGELRIRYDDGVPTLPYPGVVLIDEVDTHLHVSWQKIIGSWFKEHFPQVQFIVTTHSPYICQSADPGGLVLLPGPGDPRSAHVISQDLYERVVYGSGDDAVLTELFGVSTPYSEQAVRLRRRLGDLELMILDGVASETEREEYRSLSGTLSSSLSTRAAEIAARLGHDDDPN
jgi:energy-coupling factor transporter ATP-binding protein EcfA2